MLPDTLIWVQLDAPLTLQYSLALTCVMLAPELPSVTLHANEIAALLSTLLPLGQLVGVRTGAMVVKV